MNGVTGRMGTNQHLIRSICAIREQGGVRARRRRRASCPTRSSSAATRASSRRSRRRTASSAVTTDLDAALRRPDDTRLLRRRRRPACGPTLIRKAIAAGKHIYCEKPTAPTLAEALDLAQRAEGRRREARRRAGQALAARPAQAARCSIDSRLLRPHPLGARRVRLLGVRGRLAAGAAPVVELPQGGRRRHHRRHALPLALRARQPVRRGEVGVLPRRDAHPDALGRERQAVRRDRRRRRLRDLRARRRGAIVAQFNSSWATRVRRDDLLDASRSTARTARPSPACATAASSRARRRRSRCGTPTSRSPIDFYDALAAGARRTAPTTTPSRSSGSCSCATSSTASRSRGTCVEGAKGVQLAELGLASWARAPLGRRAARCAALTGARA